jgi:rSAM/selenodomain-associated transferase 2
MKVSIIIPALNEAAVIERAIQAAWQTGAHEVIVVDGGSQDNTIALAKAAGSQLILSNPGRAYQQNQGAAQASGDVLLFQHADNWLDDSAVEQIQNVLQKPSIIAGAFEQQIAAPGTLYRCLEWGNAWRARCWGLPYGDQGIFLRREAFEQLGGFPEVRLMEDVLLMQRVRRKRRPVLLPGPIHIDPRRWQRHGIVRQTVRNWTLLTALRLGATPNELARFYPRHDQATAKADSKSFKRQEA